MDELVRYVDDFITKGDECSFQKLKIRVPIRDPICDPIKSEHYSIFVSYLLRDYVTGTWIPKIKESIEKTKRATKPSEQYYFRGWEEGRQKRKDKWKVEMEAALRYLTEGEITEGEDQGIYHSMIYVDWDLITDIIKTIHGDAIRKINQLWVDRLVSSKEKIIERCKDYGAMKETIVMLRGVKYFKRMHINVSAGQIPIYPL